MFEKEAEDKAFEKYPIPRNWNEIELARNTKYEEGFKDGAEFGYSKANEWHYVKDGLPPKSEEFKICSEDLLFITKNGKRYFGYFNSRNEFEAHNQPYGRFRVEEVYAWKEIVFPELPKESE